MLFPYIRFKTWINAIIVTGMPINHAYTATTTAIDDAKALISNGIMHPSETIPTLDVNEL